MNSSVLDERFLEWCLSDIEREVMEGFPLLSLIGNDVTREAVRYLRKLPKKRQVAAMCGWRKGRFPPKHRFTHTEMELAEGDAFLRAAEEWRREGVAGGALRMTAGQKDALSNQIDEAFKLIPDVFEASPKRRYRSYMHAHGPYSVATNIDLGGLKHVHYDQCVSLTGAGGCLLEGIDPCSWLGVGGETFWIFRSESEFPAAIIGIPKIARHFLSGLPAWLGASQLPPAGSTAST